MTTRRSSEAKQSFNPGQARHYSGCVLRSAVRVVHGVHARGPVVRAPNKCRQNRSLKGEETECASDVNEVFGGRSRGFRYDWLLPTAPVFPESVRDDIMGYRLADKRSMSGDLEGGDEEASFDNSGKEDFKRPAAAKPSPCGLDTRPHAVSA